MFADLRPYICLAEDCTAVDKWFTRRHEWILHDIENHWRSYFCPKSCGETFASRFECVEHVQKSHPNAIPAHQLEAVIDLSSEMNRVEEMPCSICLERFDSMKKYQRHVGRHQEQLAIFALPAQSQEDNNDLADNSLDDSDGFDEHDFDDKASDKPSLKHLALLDNIRGSDANSDSIVATDVGTPLKQLKVDGISTREGHTEVSDINSSEMNSHGADNTYERGLIGGNTGGDNMTTITGHIGFESGYTASYPGKARILGDLSVDRNQAIFTGDIGGQAALDLMNAIFKNTFKKDEK